jgi:hypothetical protein
MRDDPYPAILRRSVRQAVERLDRRLSADAPTLARHVTAWTRSLAGGEPPERYFLAPASFPLLLLPWWCEEALIGDHDLEFGRDLVYSSVAGYLVVRLVDDLMDHDAPVEPPLVPAIIALQTEFVAPYRRRFPADHPLWVDLVPLTFASAEMASVDAGLARIDRSAFERIGARKTVGAKIPLTAVAHWHGRRAELGSWLEFVDVLGRWHQMANDVRDWARDLAGGRATFFLSEAAVHAGPHGSIGAWIVGDGLAWAYGELDRWMDELAAMASELGSPPLVWYLETRARSAAAARARVMAELPALRELADAMR